MTKNTTGHIKNFGEIIENTHYIVRPGAYALITDKSMNIAIIQNPAGYFLPGGGIEKNESKTEALIREIIEETGFSIKDINPIARANQFLCSDFLNGYYNKEGHFYTCSFDKKISEATEENHSLHWMNKNNAINKLSQEFQSWVVSKHF